MRQAQALLDQRRFELQDEGRAVTQEVAAAWSQLDVARASIVARREQVEAARIAAEGVAEEARLGARSTLDVLDADQERLQAEAEVVQALRDEYVATYALLQAMGLLTVEHLKLGIETYDPDVYFKQVQQRPARRLRHLGRRPDPRALGAQLSDAGRRGGRTDGDRGRGGVGEPESLAEVLASIRALVSAETEARVAGAGESGHRADADAGDAYRPAARPSLLAEGLGDAAAGGQAPILDEESLREMINAIVREELQGELGDRISRNLRKLIRREIAEVLEEQRKG